jgi:hypothetical protein
MTIIVLLVAHHCATIVSQLSHYMNTQMPLLVTYETLSSYNIGIILQLDGHYGATT